MVYMDGVLALLGVCVISLFFAKMLDTNAGLLPLLVLCGSCLWLLGFGLAGQLWLGGALWFAVAALALAALLLLPAPNGVKMNPVLSAKDALNRAMVPGFVFFMGASLLFWCVFALTKPMFIRWDEFTFWGVACKMTKQANMLHSVAAGNLAARSYLPGMMLLTYLFQFLGIGFAEWKCFAAYDILAAAAFACFAAGEKKRWPLCVLALTGAVLLPYFFMAPGDEGISTIYLTCMGDASLGLVFGGALCLYWRGKDKLSNLVLCVLPLAFLVTIKDMGLAYAMIAAAFIALDRFIYPKVSLKSFFSAAVGGICMAVPCGGLYVAWSRHVLAATGVNKAEVGNSSKRVFSYGEMLTDGVKQLLGSGDVTMTQKFNMVKNGMLQAVMERPLSLAGSAAAVVAVMAALVLLAVILAPKGQRRRAVWFGIASLACFVVFVVFHLLLYVYSFGQSEAELLKDYERYISPFLMGWMLGLLGLLWLLAEQGKFPRLGQGTMVLVSAGLCAVFCLRGVPAAGFWNYPQENYAERRDVAKRAEIVNVSLKPEDTVMLISQGDDGTRWYYYAYELNAQLSHGFAGDSYTDDPDVSWETTFMSLVNPYDDSFHSERYAYQEQYEYTALCTHADLIHFLQDKRYDYLLIDQSDTYVMYEFKDMFEEKCPWDWQPVSYLYSIEYDDRAENPVRFVPAGEVRYVPKHD